MSENRKKKTRETADNGKTELANRIASQSRKVANTYQHIGDNLVRIFRWFSGFIDKTLFNRKYTKLVSLVLAVMMYAIVNLNSSNSMNMSTLKTSKDLTNISVTAKYNSDTFELSGLPSEADITISGDASSVTAASNSKGVVVADLEGLTEGTHNVKLKTEGFGENVTIRIDPSNVSVTLKKKTTQQFDLSYDYINQDKMDSIYSLGTPTFEYTKVNVLSQLPTVIILPLIAGTSDKSVFRQISHQYCHPTTACRCSQLFLYVPHYRILFLLFSQQHSYHSPSFWNLQRSESGSSSSDSFHSVFRIDKTYRKYPYTLC